MHKYILPDPWKIIENKFDPALHPNSESLFSIGNGRLGQRANFEEYYSGESLQGSYVAGVYYPDKTRVGWWKNGYPEYFAKVLNSVQWHNIDVAVEGERIDLAKVKILSFYRELDMKRGVLSKRLQLKTSAGHTVEVFSERFYSVADPDMAFAKYQITPISGNLHITLTSSLDTDVRNSDANYDDDFWQDRSAGTHHVTATTKKTKYTVGAAMKHHCNTDHQSICGHTSHTESRCEETFTISAQKGEQITLLKYVAITSSRYMEVGDVVPTAQKQCTDHATTGYEPALGNHQTAWSERWQLNDITIDGDVEAQQGIRFNIYQLYQTYDGRDARLNIGPKGFTGEKYGGSTYWDTEAYCLPFYMSTASTEVARNLLVYRHQQLDKAIENAEKLGFTRGAALYPMVTMNGEECHNEWEITFEEIHRNGAIAYAIYDYIRYTGDRSYLGDYGIDVLVGISRFWAQRVHWSAHRQQYVMLGVTGPNEYENNVDNNWYTNYIARWCMKYTLDCLHELSASNQKLYKSISERLQLHQGLDHTKWEHIIQNMFLPEDQEKGIFLQQSGFLDKEELTVADLRPEDRPINQNWSWDRILRSPFIKQADVLQGLYFFEDDFTEEELRKNFLYYEPKTVHESSLSPCVHSILAAKLGMYDKAYEMYVRTARLDLDDYNNDTEDGCHITSMAGTWMSIVEGFAGMRVGDDHLRFNPFLPKQWTGYSFKILYRDQLLHITVNATGAVISHLGQETIKVDLDGTIHALLGGAKLTA